MNVAVGDSELLIARCRNPVVTGMALAIVAVRSRKAFSFRKAVIKNPNWQEPKHA
jgi:hypothetical protein